MHKITLLLLSILVWTSSGMYGSDKEKDFFCTCSTLILQNKLFQVTSSLQKSQCNGLKSYEITACNKGFFWNIYANTQRHYHHANPHAIVERNNSSITFYRYPTKLSVFLAGFAAGVFICRRLQNYKVSIERKSPLKN